MQLPEDVSRAVGHIALATGQSVDDVVASAVKRCYMSPNIYPDQERQDRAIFFSAPIVDLVKGMNRQMEF